MTTKPRNYENAEDTEKLAQALVALHSIRDSIAKFIARNCDAADEIVAHCDKNCWDSGVAYDMRSAIATLGGVLATLVLWDSEVLPADPKPVLKRVDALERAANEPEAERGKTPPKARIGALLEQAIYDYVYKSFGANEAECPSWNIKGLATHLAHVVHSVLNGVSYTPEHEIKYEDD